jgi:hypothetical protein
VIKADYQGLILQDEKRFFTPLCPPRISFLNPSPEQPVQGLITVTVHIASQSRVARVEYYVDDELQLETSSEPYEFPWDTSLLPEGAHTLRAIIHDAEGLTDAEEISVFVMPLPTPSPALVEELEVVKEEEEIEEPGVEEEQIAFGPILALCAGATGLLILGVILVARGRKKPEFWEEEFVPTGSELIQTADISEEVMTADVAVGLMKPVAKLTVMRSLELSRGESFDLYPRSILIGRGPDNDIVIPDLPVSREHAELRYEAGGFYIYDRGSTYGTKVNGRPVTPEGIKLEDKARIQLGTRTVLEFNLLEEIEEETAELETRDVGGPEETRDVSREEA